MLDILIRPLAIEDMDKILKLQTSALRILSAGYSDRQIESLVRGQGAARSAGDEVGYVAVCAQQMVGFGLVQVSSEYIAGIYVHPGFARRGIGTRLLLALEKLSLERKVKTMHVLSSMAAVDFYRANGYELIQADGFHSEENIWIPCMRMEKRLIVGLEDSFLDSMIASVSGVWRWY
jgi:putative acetyltransferase